MNNKDISKIVVKVIEDRDTNFQLLYSSTYNTVYSMAYTYFKNIHDAEDITQDVFIKIYNNINSLNNPMAFNSWLNKIVINTCHHYKKNNNKDITNVINEELYFNTIVEENEDYIPDKALEKKDVKLLLLKYMDKIPELQSEILMLHYYRGLKVKEIADILDLNTQVVKNRLFQGRKSLKIILEEIQAKHKIRIGGFLFFPSIGKIYKSSLEIVESKINSGIGLKKSNSKLQNPGNVVVVAITVVLMTSVLSGIIGGVIQLSQNNDAEKIVIVKSENDESSTDVDNQIIEDESKEDINIPILEINLVKKNEDPIIENKEPELEKIIFTSFQPDLSEDDKLIPRYLVGNLLDELGLINEEEYNLVLSIPGLIEVDPGLLWDDNELYSLKVWALNLNILINKTFNNNYVIYSWVEDISVLDYSLVNLDINGDTIADLNIDFNDDGVIDLNVDLDFDGLPDLNVDMDRDGTADLNIDLNSDGVCELNIDTIGDWLPDLNVDTDGDNIPNYNIDQNSDGKPDYLIKH